MDYVAAKPDTRHAEGQVAAWGYGGLKPEAQKYQNAWEVLGLEEIVLNG
jgi:hypothetical protein